LSRYGSHSDLLSFPTRRSSDLLAPFLPQIVVASDCVLQLYPLVLSLIYSLVRIQRKSSMRLATSLVMPSSLSKYSNRLKIEAVRSEEHTSELQSRENLVCRLLL